MLELLPWMLFDQLFGFQPANTLQQLSVRYYVALVRAIPSAWACRYGPPAPSLPCMVATGCLILQMPCILCMQSFMPMPQAKPTCMTYYHTQNTISAPNTICHIGRNDTHATPQPDEWSPGASSLCITQVFTQGGAPPATVSAWQLSRCLWVQRAPASGG